MADATLQISEASTGPAPLEYIVPPAQQFTLMGVRAVFDGTAAGAFVPVLQILSDSGRVMAQTKGDPVAAGGSADVTFAPFLESTAQGGSGIDFDVYPQSGDWLEVETSSTLPASVYNALLARFPGKGFGFWASIGTLLLAINGDLAIVAPDGTGSIDIIAFKSANAVLNMEAWEWFGDFSFVQLTADSDMELAVSGAADLQLTRGGTGHLKFNNLPVVNPGGVGRVWNNGGVLSIT